MVQRAATSRSQSGKQCASIAIKCLAGDMGRQDAVHLSAQRRGDRHTLDEKRDRVRQQQQRQAML